MLPRIALISTLLVLAIAAPAGAQSGSAFGPLPDAVTPTPTVAATATPDDGTTGRDTLFIIGGALIIGFGVMGYFILRDARTKLPEDERAHLNRARDQGPHAHQKQAKAKARERTRRQKQARKANRPRA